MIFQRERLHLAVGALFAFGLGSCPESPPEPESPLIAYEHPEFFLLWRWSDPTQLTWVLETSGETVESITPDVLRETLERALATWTATGVVGFRPAAGDEEAQIRVSFQSGTHGPCTPFGHDGSRAHTVPVEDARFVHIDADGEWSVDGDRGASLYQALLHEIGHVLGLGHTTDPAAVMHPDVDRRRTTLRASDLAGIHSLYGGGTDHESDVVIRSTQAERDDSTILRRVARVGLTGLSAFDTDGDGRDELMVRRTDEQGHGTVVLYHFAHGPRVERTVGPLFGIAPPGARVRCGVEADGRRFIARCFDNGKLSVLTWNDDGIPTARALAPFEGAGFIDVDGDGIAEVIEDEGEAVLRGDFDGDGTDEVVVRMTMDDE